MGEIGAYGVSNFDAAQLEAAIEAGNPQAIQNNHSLLERADEADVLPLCAERGVAYLVFSPLAGGWLTGKYRRGEPFPGGSRMTQRPEPYDKLLNDRTFDALDRLGALGRERNMSMAGVALAWLLADERIAQVVIGPGRPGAPTTGRRGAAKPADQRRASLARHNLRTVRVLILSHDDVHKALTPEDCADAMASVLAAHARGEAFMPLRSIMAPPGAAGFMGLMPGWRGARAPDEPSPAADGAEAEAERGRRRARPARTTTRPTRRCSRSRRSA